MTAPPDVAGLIARLRTVNNLPLDRQSPWIAREFLNEAAAALAALAQERDGFRDERDTCRANFSAELKLRIRAEQRLSEVEELLRMSSELQAKAERELAAMRAVAEAHSQRAEMAEAATPDAERYRYIRSVAYKKNELRDGPQTSWTMSVGCFDFREDVSLDAAIDAERKEQRNAL